MKNRANIAFDEISSLHFTLEVASYLKENNSDIVKPGIKKTPEQRYYEYEITNILSKLDVTTLSEMLENYDGDIKKISSDPIKMNVYRDAITRIYNQKLLESPDDLKNITVGLYKYLPLDTISEYIRVSDKGKQLDDLKKYLKTNNIVKFDIEESSNLVTLCTLFEFLKDDEKLKKIITKRIDDLDKDHHAQLVTRDFYDSISSPDIKIKVKESHERAREALIPLTKDNDTSSTASMSDSKSQDSVASFNEGNEGNIEYFITDLFLYEKLNKASLEDLVLFATKLDKFKLEYEFKNTSIQSIIIDKLHSHELLDENVINHLEALQKGDVDSSLSEEIAGRLKENKIVLKSQNSLDIDKADLAFLLSRGNLDFLRSKGNLDFSSADDGEKLIHLRDPNDQFAENNPMHKQSNLTAEKIKQVFLGIMGKNSFNSEEVQSLRKTNPLANKVFSMKFIASLYDYSPDACKEAFKDPYLQGILNLVIKKSARGIDRKDLPVSRAIGSFGLFSSRKVAELDKLKSLRDSLNQTITPKNKGVK